MNPTTERQCVHCDQPLERRRGENADDWRARKYCNFDCYRKAVAPDPGPLSLSMSAKMLLADTAWAVNTACKGVDPELFDARDTGRVDDPMLANLRAVAADHCRGCHTLTACRAYGRRRRSEGVWGGEYRYRSAGRLRTIDLLAEPEAGAA